MNTKESKATTDSVGKLGSASDKQLKKVSSKKITLTK
jgi:hypothetical protein